MLAVLASTAAAEQPASNGGTPQPTHGAVFIDQIGAPGDWMDDPHFWLFKDRLAPADPLGAGFALIIADPGNVATQSQAGSGQQGFILQWGSGNTAAQRQGGATNLAEIVQVSPGAAMTKGANAGGGNGGEFDLFGFEIDPGNSSANNQAKEPSGAGTAPGTGNWAEQVQDGSVNFARAVQIGWENRSSQSQTGSGNEAVTVQIGQGNEAVVVQTGAGNHSDIVQTGTGNKATVTQGSGD